MSQFRQSEFRRLLLLAAPMIVMNIANMGIGVIDTIMAGRFSSYDMAAVAMGSSIFFPVLLFAQGVLSILGPVIAHLRGEQKSSRIGYIVNHGFWITLGLSVFCLLVLVCLVPILPHIVSAADVFIASKAERYVYWISLGLPANLFFILLRSLNEGMNMTRAAMFVALVSCLLNIPLNLIFVHGYFGFPPMGGEGCGLASACVFWLQLVFMFCLVYRHPSHRPHRKQMLSMRKPVLSQITQVLKLGVPVGVSIFFEVLLFCMGSLVLAPLGYVAVSSHQIASNVSGVYFMVPLSIGYAVSIRVAYHQGRGEPLLTRKTIRSDIDQLRVERG